jgi:hypothetical protein
MINYTKRGLFKNPLKQKFANTKLKCARITLKRGFVLTKKSVSLLMENFRFLISNPRVTLTIGRSHAKTSGKQGCAVMAPGASFLIMKEKPLKRSSF